MTTNNNNDSARVEKYSQFQTILCKRFLLGLNLTNIFQLPKVKALSQVQDTDTTATDIEYNGKEVRRNEYNTIIASAPSSSSINNGNFKLYPSKTNVINGVDIGQFISENEVQEYLKNETGMDRLLEMFSKNHVNEYSSQIRFIGSVVGEVAALSFILFSCKYGQSVTEHFKRNNRGTLYGSRYLAKRRFNDHLIINSLKNGLHWTVKISSFTAIYLLLSQSISTYRNKTSPLEYGIAAALTGGFFRLNMGPRGVFAGALISGPLGILFGTIASGLFFLFNSTQEQRHYRTIQTKLYEKKESQGILPPLPPMTSTKIQSGYGGDS